MLETGKKDAASGAAGDSASAYYKTRRVLIDSDEALDYEPLVVRRLRRHEEYRRRARFEGRSVQP